MFSFFITYLFFGVIVVGGAFILAYALFVKRNDDNIGREIVVSKNNDSNNNSAYPVGQYNTLTLAEKRKTVIETELENIIYNDSLISSFLKRIKIGVKSHIDKGAHTSVTGVQMHALRAGVDVINAHNDAMIARRKYEMSSVELETIDLDKETIRLRKSREQEEEKKKIADLAHGKSESKLSPEEEIKKRLHAELNDTFLFRETLEEYRVQKHKNLFDGFVISRGYERIEEASPEEQARYFVELKYLNDMIDKMLIAGK